MAGTGAILTLSAIGKQDEFLSTSNVQDSFWVWRTVKHTPFTLFYRSRPLFRNQSPDSNWPFGSTITFKINPKTSGDVLTNCYLKLTLPKGNNYCDQIGNALIKEYSFMVGEQNIQTVSGDWNVIHDELYASNTERFAKNFLINGGSPLGTVPPTSNDVNVYVPLNFFFSRYKTITPGNWKNNRTTGNETNSADTFKSYFLMCACTQQFLYVQITFNPITFFSDAGSISLEKIQLVTEEATLSDEEVAYYNSNPQTLVYNTVQRQPVFRLDRGEGVKNSGSVTSGCPSLYKDQLITNIPVKAFHWIIRDQRYEDVNDNTYYLNRYNFSSNPTATPYTEVYNQILSDARIFINGESQLGFFESLSPPFTNTTGANYFRFVVPSTHGYSSPNRNIYTYSFSLNPREPTPSGALNFNVVDSSKTYINGHVLDTATSNTYNVNTYYIGYTILKYENDFCTSLFM